jgi:hypothetical protein
MESPNTSICEIPKTCWSCGVLRNCGTPRIQWNGCIPRHFAVPKQSSSIQGIFGQGGLTVQRAGVGQQVKPTKCRAGGGWVGGSAYSHKATSQTNLDESPQHLARPLSTGGAYHPPPMWGPDRFCKTYHNPSDKGILMATVRSSSNK